METRKHYGKRAWYKITFVVNAVWEPWARCLTPFIWPLRNITMAVSSTPWFVTGKGLKLSFDWRVTQA